jgi:hypothetical protein
MKAGHSHTTPSREAGRVQMKYLIIATLAIAALAGLGVALMAGQRDVETGRDKVVRIPAGIDHSDYDRLLKIYADERGLVDYSAWLNHAEDRQALKDYLRQYAPAPEKEAEGDELSAALINAYNAFAMDYILDNYPVDSIMSLSHPFGGRRFTVGGEQVSLDDIEHGTLIPHYGYRTHAVVVCVARSCPPLRREAYLAERLDEQVTDTFQEWLARADLNRFHPQENKVEISSVFTWFSDDFEKAGGVRAALARYGPEEHREFLSGEDYTVSFVDYNWALNDQQPREFSRIRQGWNRFLDFFR